MTKHPGHDYRLVDVLFPCPERVNTMTSYEMEQDMSPDIIYYRKYSIFYLDSSGSSKRFANNLLILHVLYQLLHSVSLSNTISGKGQGCSQGGPIPLTQARTAAHADWVLSGSYENEKELSLGAGPWTLPLSCGFGGEFFFI